MEMFSFGLPESDFGHHPPTRGQDFYFFGVGGGGWGGGWVPPILLASEILANFFQFTLK
jgi:hypothetical protein